MFEIDALLESVVGEDEWARHRVLERVRAQPWARARLEDLVSAFSGDDASRRAGARMLLAALAAPDSASADDARAVLLDALADPDPDVRVLAASALGEARSSDSVEAAPSAAGDALIAALDDPEPNVAAAAADALGELAWAPALEPLAKAAASESYWVRAAAVVALGRLGHEQAIPVLERVAEAGGLERPLVEALRRIHHPDALRVLAVIEDTAPQEALIAAGAILAAHPEEDPPEWVKARAVDEAEALRVMLVEDDDPAVARALGIAATPSAVDTLMALVGPPRRSEAALTGLLAVPADVRSAALLDRLPDADRDEQVALLALLPPQVDPSRLGALVPLLSDSDPTLRAAAAGALARAPTERALPLLSAELERTGVAPEVVRAMGGLGTVVCDALLPLLDDPESSVRAAAAEALSRCREPSVVDALDRALGAEERPEPYRALLRGLGRVAGAAAVAPLARALGDDAPETRLAAIEGLGGTGSPDAVEPLERALEGTTSERLAAIRALGDLDTPGAFAAIRPFLDAADLDERRTAAYAAVQLANHVSADAVDRMVEDRDEWVRLCAVRVLARGTAAGRERLEALVADDPASIVREEARRMLQRKR